MREKTIQIHLAYDEDFRESFNTNEIYFYKTKEEADNWAKVIPAKLTVEVPELTKTFSESDILSVLEKVTGKRSANHRVISELFGLQGDNNDNEI